MTGAEPVWRSHNVAMYQNLSSANGIVQLNLHVL